MLGGLVGIIWHRLELVLCNGSSSLHAKGLEVEFVIYIAEGVEGRDNLHSTRKEQEGMWVCCMLSIVYLNCVRSFYIDFGVVVHV